MIKIVRAGAIAATGLLFSAGHAFSAVPDEKPGAAPVVEEITVTARRREESLQSVPVAVSAFTASDLQVRDVINLERLADQTPGLSFGNGGSLVNRRAIIRGMSQQTRVGDETNVATFVDGVYTPGFSGAEFFDFDSLERIEVLKGPQSAVYGRNSFAGAINYVTAKPRYEGDYGAQVTAGDNERRGLSAYYSGPLIDDTLAVRLDAGFNRSGGTNTNSLDGDPLGSTDTAFIRLGSRWDPTERLNIGLSLSWQQDETSPTAVTMVADDDSRLVGRRADFTYSPFEAAAGGGEPLGRLYQGAITNTSDSYFIDTRSYAGDRDIFRATLTFNYAFDGFELVGVTGYQNRETDTLSDYNTCRPDVRSAVCDTVSPAANGTFFGGPLVSAPIVGGVLTGTVEDRDELSQDLRLQSTGEGNLQWAAGVYASTEDFTDQSHRLSDVDLTSTAGTIYAVASSQPLLDSSTLISNDFYSIYGSLGYDIGNAWNVALEGRYTREEKQSDQVANNFPDSTPPTGYQEKDFSFFTPRLIVSFTPTDAMLVYASAAKGVKSGGFNPGSEQVPTFDQEENWTYELGAKSTFLDGRAWLNGALYFVDWEDQQVTSVDPDNQRLPITTNVARTEIKGIELEGFLAPTDWLRLNAGFSYTDAEYKEGASTLIEYLADCENLPIECDLFFPPVNAFVTSGKLDGQQVIGAPKTTFNGGAQVNWPLPGRDWGLMARLDYIWQDKTFLDEANSGYIPSRETVNLRLGVENDRWSVEGFCNNLTDDDTPIFALPPRDILGVPHNAVLNRDERMCGMQAAYRN